MRWSFLASGFVIALIVLAGFTSFVLAHEATHLLLADEANGICFGRCNYNSPNLDNPVGISIASASGVHNDESMKEFLPNVVGLVVLTFVIVAGMICLAVDKKE